jgi:hypothetical protein
MQTNHGAPVIVSREIDVAAEATIIWDVLTNIQDWPAWDPKVKSATLPGQIEEGIEFHWRTGFSSITSMIQSVDRPHSISWSGKTFGINAYHEYGFEPSGSGTLVRTVESWDGPLVRLLRVPIRKMLRESLEAGLSHLKTECERRVSASQSL